MLQQDIFTVYNASAGSGKTFTLVKSYLEKIISSNRPDFFKHLLAITFTNKAVNEMKHRIISKLFDFAKPDIFEKGDAMFSVLCSETQLPPQEVQKRAKRAVEFILQNYSLFDVETIDKFNHRIIRTFAKDLKISSNFDLVLDVKLLLQEAIDNMIARVGKDEALTQVVLDFTIEKAKEDKSWDIAYDLQNIGMLLLSENNTSRIKTLKNKTIDDFLRLKKNLFAKREKAKEEILKSAEDFFQLLEKHQLEDSDFSGKYVFNYFQKLSIQDFSVNYGAGWQNFTPPIYPGRVKPPTSQTLDNLTPAIAQLFEKSKVAVYQFGFFNALLRNINSLMLLNSIQKEFIALQEEKNVLPISAFNTLISNEIKNQPAPFIYERLGEKYRHYFIDEFQDTSQLQWQNLVPLIDNALSQAETDSVGGSLLIVGDAKQSIYRWRGGYPEQFIKLFNKKIPFTLEDVKVDTLATNRRSYDEIIRFNNDFFTYLSKCFFDETHQELYKTGNSQQTNTNIGGYVSIDFVDTSDKEAYLEKTLEIVNQTIKNGFQPEEICILVRKNDQAIDVAKYLTEKGLDVTSAEALHLSFSPEIQCILNVLKVLVNFENKLAKAALLEYVYLNNNVNQEEYLFVKNLLDKNKKTFSDALKQYQIDFDFENSESVSLYELCEEIIRKWIGTDKAAAYLLSFLEIVFDYTIRDQGNISEFLDYWETLTRAYVDNSGQSNAIQVMTVHKSKGLEFPVVIYPFVEDTIQFVNNPMVWIKLNQEEYSGFSEWLLPLTQSLETFGDEYATLYQENVAKLELDTINILYVAQTRAIEQLYIIAKDGVKEDKKNVSAFLKSYLKEINRMEEGVLSYTFGQPQRLSVKEINATEETQFLTSLQSTSATEHQILIATGSALLWDTEQEKAIEKGNLTHEILSKIIHKNDLTSALDYFTEQGSLGEEQRKLLTPTLIEIIENPALTTYFNGSSPAAAEREVYLDNGTSLRLDRINFLSENQITIIDYKTGVQDKSHKDQIEQYAHIMSKMGFTIIEKLLVYIQDNIEVVKV